VLCLLILLLFGNRVSSTVFTCSGNTGCFFCIRIFDLVTVGSAENLLALNLAFFLCNFFFSLLLGFLYILLVTTAFTVSQVRLVAVLTMVHWADNGSSL